MWHMFTDWLYINLTETRVRLAPESNDLARP
jgi:hypothetical protein